MPSREYFCAMRVTWVSKREREHGVKPSGIGTLVCVSFAFNGFNDGRWQFEFSIDYAVADRAFDWKATSFFMVLSR